MSKALLLSVKPRFVAKILNGEKTIEIRKTMPKCELPIDVYIYCTKSNYLGFISNRYIGKVVAKFTLNKVEEITYDSTYKAFKLNSVLQNSCLEEEELNGYLKGRIGYAWHITNLVIFDKPKELSEFRTVSKVGIPQYEFGVGTCDYKKLAKAPQSWCYIETGE